MVSVSNITEKLKLQSLDDHASILTSPSTQSVGLPHSSKDDENKDDVNKDDLYYPPDEPSGASDRNVESDTSTVSTCDVESSNRDHDSYWCRCPDWYACSSDNCPHIPPAKRHRRSVSIPWGFRFKSDGGRLVHSFNRHYSGLVTTGLTRPVAVRPSSNSRPGRTVQGSAEEARQTREGHSRDLNHNHSSCFMFSGSGFKFSQPDVATSSEMSFMTLSPVRFDRTNVFTSATDPSTIPDAASGLQHSTYSDSNDAFWNRTCSPFDKKGRSQKKRRRDDERPTLDFCKMIETAYNPRMAKVKQVYKAAHMKNTTTNISNVYTGPGSNMGPGSCLGPGSNVAPGSNMGPASMVVNALRSTPLISLPCNLREVNKDEGSPEMNKEIVSPENIWQMLTSDVEGITPDADRITADSEGNPKQRRARSQGAHGLHATSEFSLNNRPFSSPQLTKRLVDLQESEILVSRDATLSCAPPMSPFISLHQHFLNADGEIEEEGSPRDPAICLTPCGVDLTKLLETKANGNSELDLELIENN